MSPITVHNNLGGGTNYVSPFVGPIDHTASIPVDLSALTNKEIDAQGYLKPGVPLDETGALVGAATRVYGVTIEPMKYLADNEAATIAAAGVVWVAVATICQVNRAAAEDMLDRAYTANEVAGFGLSSCILID